MSTRQMRVPLAETGARDEVLRPAAVAKVWTGVGAPLETMAVPGVVLGPGDVIVAVELATICASDVEVFEGRRPARAPLVLGHENVGRVIAIGSGGAADVAGIRLQLGDRVVWSAGASCGACEQCSAGTPQRCRNLRRYGHERVGSRWELSGGFATHVHVIAGTAIVPVGERMPARVAAPAGCGAATAWSALRRAEREGSLAGAVVLIEGAGLVGLSAAAIAESRGAVVIVSDPDKRRRKLALRFGAAAVIDPHDARALDLALATVGRTVVDVVIEASGCAVVVDVVVPAGAHVRGPVTIAGFHDYTGEDLRGAIAFLRESSGRYPFEDLVDPVFSLDAIDEAFPRAAEGGPQRVGIDPRR